MVGVGPNAQGGTVIWWINEVKPLLDCEGALSWTKIQTGEPVTGSFTLENKGGKYSYLDWAIIEKPGWCEWNFTPISGDDLVPGILVTINVNVVAPPQKNQRFNGEIKVVNLENNSDYDIIPVSLTTPMIYNNYFQIFGRFFERFPNAFLILRHLIGY